VNEAALRPYLMAVAPRSDSPKRLGNENAHVISLVVPAGDGGAGTSVPSTLEYSYVLPLGMAQQRSQPRYAGQHRGALDWRHSLYSGDFAFDLNGCVRHSGHRWTPVVEHDIVYF
jgi:hypothetical protein